CARWEDEGLDYGNYHFDSW
nr:immunoglobulin heavy chain junction region [Macaca mulatta]